MERKARLFGIGKLGPKSRTVRSCPGQSKSDSALVGA